MALCRDPKTGKVTVTAGATCPAGTVPVNQTGSPAAGGGDAQVPAPERRGPVGNSQGYAYMPRPWERVTVDTSNPRGVANASNYGSSTWNEEVAAPDVVTEWEMLDPDIQDQVDAIAKSIDYRGTGRSLWERAVGASELSVRQGNPRTVWDFIRDRAAEAGGGDDPRGTGPRGRGPGGGGGGGAVPMPAGRDAIKRAMDTMALDLIGRTLSEDEVDRYYSQYVKQFGKNPNMDMQASGIDALQSNVDYQEFQVAQKFASAFDSVLRGSA